MQQGQTPKIAGDWMPVDDTKNHLDLAPTDTFAEGDKSNPVLAIRDSFLPDQYTFVTRRHIDNLVRSWDDNLVGRLTRTGGSTGRSGGSRPGG